MGNKAAVDRLEDDRSGSRMVAEATRAKSRRVIVGDQLEPEGAGPSGKISQYASQILHFVPLHAESRDSRRHCSAFCRLGVSRIDSRCTDYLAPKISDFTGSKLA